YFSQLLITIILLLVVNSVLAQDTTQSLAFRNNKPQRKQPTFYRPDLAYQIWQQFKLTQEANAGDPLAQHELGLRYLLGEGIPADTVQAVYWIHKAAQTNLSAAKYNYGIMLINGIGVQWDPFSAFKYFKFAANAGMVQAQYIVGILYTDNLIVKRNWNLAYYWIKKSADGKFEPASKIVTLLEPRISEEVVDSLFSIKKEDKSDKEFESDPKDPKLTSGIGLSFIDFESLTDSVIQITDSMIVADIETMAADTIIQSFKKDTLYNFDEISSSEKIKLLSEIADNGSPEALTILGRMYEQGIYFNQNEITAATYYYRALRNDSPKATHLLYQFAGRKEFIDKLHSDAKNGNPDAEFTWYGLVSSGFDRTITLDDAIKLLTSSALKNHIPSMIELGLNYYTGRFATADLERGIQIWKQAELLGSKEASVRLAASRIFDSMVATDVSKDFEILKISADNGSLLAQVSIAMCYEQGIGTTKSISEAVNFYRSAAQRGSQFAYERLKNIFDERRPNEQEFIISY
ncbi:MAG TPA: tetratricopeptide repeat protein, partial [Ignavibacteriaceae bacterium]